MVQPTHLTLPPVSFFLRQLGCEKDVFLFLIFEGTGAILTGSQTNLNNINSALWPTKM
jgi:hypothetical protein